MCTCMYVYVVGIYVLLLFYKLSPDNSFSGNNSSYYTHPTLSNMADISQSPHHTNTHVYKHQS